VPDFWHDEPVSIFLVFLAAALLIGTAAAAAGLRLRGSGRGARRGPWVFQGLAEPAGALPPVLLPENPRAADVGAVRFGRALQGYRTDQVHEVLERLAGALAERDVLIEELRRGASTCPAGGKAQQ
jgi:DivIVA domain-containing protein